MKNRSLLTPQKREPVNVELHAAWYVGQVLAKNTMTLKFFPINYGNKYCPSNKVQVLTLAALLGVNPSDIKGSIIDRLDRLREMAIKQGYTLEVYREMCK